MQVSSVTLQTLGKGEAGGKGGEEMEGFKETHNERKLFFKYTVLLLCKSTQHTGVVKKPKYITYRAGPGEMLGVGFLAKPLLPSHNEPVWVSGQDTRTTRMDEGTQSHTLTGQCCA